MDKIISLLVHEWVWNVFKFLIVVCGPGISFAEGIVWPQASQTCCDIPLFLGKDIPIYNFLFILRGGDGGDGLENRYIHLGLPSAWKVSSREEDQYTRRGSSDE